MGVESPERPRASQPTPSGPSVARALAQLGLAIVRAIARGVRRLRRWNARDGAGASGLAALVELHALQAAGDAVISVALAGSLFFSVSTDTARTRIALY